MKSMKKINSPKLQLTLSQMKSITGGLRSGCTKAWECWNRTTVSSDFPNGDIRSIIEYDDGSQEHTLTSDTAKSSCQK